jgi:hypothetical protein
MNYLLRSLLHNPDFTLRLQNLERRIKDDYLRFWQVHAPHYTDHGETHCEAVEINLNELIPDNIKQNMNEYEIFLLLSSVLLHDIGIMCAVKKDEKTEEIRSNHHERSREFVLKNLTDLLNFPERLIIGEISYAHRDSVPIENLGYAKSVRHSKLGDVNVRVQFLSSLLRFSDACDICHTRTSEEFAGVSKLSEESTFYHDLHRRVSGINFDHQNKSIILSISIGSDKEKAICDQFIVDKLKKSFNTVRDVFIRNDIFYVDIVPSYSYQVSLEPLSVPPSIEKKQKMRPFETGILKSLSSARVAFINKDYKKSIKLLKKVLKEKPNDLFSIYLLAESLSNEGDFKRATEWFEKIVELNPKSDAYWGVAGHFFGEVNLDIEKSFNCLRKAYELSPLDLSHILNYAEALNTVGKWEEAYQLSTRWWKEAGEVRHLWSAQIIRVCSLFLQSKKEEGLKEIQRFINFCKGLPETFTTSWVYRKVRKYLQENLQDTRDKKLLLALLDFVEKKTSLGDFEKIFSEKDSK